MPPFRLYTLFIKIWAHSLTHTFSVIRSEYSILSEFSTSENFGDRIQSMFTILRIVRTLFSFLLALQHRISYALQLLNASLLLSIHFDDCILIRISFCDQLSVNRHSYRAESDSTTSVHTTMTPLFNAYQFWAWSLLYEPILSQTIQYIEIHSIWIDWTQSTIRIFTLNISYSSFILPTALSIGILLISIFGIFLEFHTRI